MYKPELGIELEEHPHIHPEDQSPLGYTETVMVASGTGSAITKTLTYTTNSMLEDGQTVSFTTDSFLAKPD
jgi:hypothetical protein